MIYSNKRYFFTIQALLYIALFWNFCSAVGVLFWSRFFYDVVISCLVGGRGLSEYACVKNDVLSLWLVLVGVLSVDIFSSM